MMDHSDYNSACCKFCSTCCRSQVCVCTCGYVCSKGMGARCILRTCGSMVCSTEWV